MKNSSAILLVLAASGLVIGSIGFVVSIPKRGVAADASGPAAEIAREQSIAEAALNELIQQQRGGEATSGTYSEVTTWSERLIRLLRDQHLEKQKVVDALEKHVSLMEANQATAKALSAAGQTPRIALYNAEYGLLQAKLALAEAKGR